MPSGPAIFDRALLRARLRRAGQLGVESFLIDHVAADMAERLSAVLRQFDHGADIGTPSDAVRRALAAAGQVTSVDAVAIGDDEVLDLAPGSLDLAVSALALQFVNDLPGLLIQLRRALKSDGLLLAALAGGDTLIELRQSFAAAESEMEGGLSPRVAPFADVRDVGALLQRAGFALPVVDSERLTVRYDTVFALMRDLRRMAATNILHDRRRTPLRRSTLLRMAEIYARRFADPDGRLRATFEIVWISGWTPHESQQKPLRPGSARARLADALGTKEVPAGEKTRRS
jgi:SAM-dependent methyltransferase